MIRTGTSRWFRGTSSRCTEECRNRFCVRVAAVVRGQRIASILTTGTSSGAVPRNRSTHVASVSCQRVKATKVIEAGSIIFLFYSNLLMGEFERSGMGQKRGLVWAIRDILTAANFEIATITALSAYILFEFLRKRF
jgi:hypothetical protein